MKTKTSSHKFSCTEGHLLFSSSTTVIAILLVCAFPSCKRRDTPAIVPVIKLSPHTTLGSHLVDKDGNSLYYFSNDSVAVNTCTGGCANIWPAFYATNLNTATLGTGLDLTDFAEITTTAGAKQSTYKGRPLYYYAPLTGGSNVREAAGEVRGEGVGGVWFVAKPDYTVMLTRAQLVGANAKKYVYTIASPTPTYTEGDGKSVYFTDAKGVALYTFRLDKQNTNTYTDAAFTKNTIWPIYEMEKIVVPSVLDKTLFSVINVFGKKQLTYKGWPLYYFGQDGMVMGATKGVSFPSVGVWPVATKELVAAPAP